MPTLSSSQTQVKNFFDQAADTYHNSFVDDPVARQKLQLLLDLWDLKSNSDVLEVGAGTGDLTSFLLDRIKPRGKVILLDISPRMLALAKSKLASQLTRTVFIQANIQTVRHLPFPVDTILFFNSFPHILDKTQALQNCSHLVSSNGHIIVSHNHCRQKINQIHQDKHIDSSISHFPTSREMYALANHGGLTVNCLSNNVPLDYYYLKMTPSV